MSRSNQKSRAMFLLFFLDVLAPPTDLNNNNTNDASTVVDIDSLTRTPVDGAEGADIDSLTSTPVDGAEGASGSGYTASTILGRTTSHGALNLIEGVSNRITHSSSSVTGSTHAATAQPASTSSSRTLMNSHDLTNFPPQDDHHQGESSSSTSTSTLPKNPRCPDTDKKKKGVLLCDADSESMASHTCSSSSYNINRGAITQQHPATYHNPSSNLDPFLKFLREQELSKNLTQIAIAVATCLYGTSEAIHPKMRSALVLLLSVGLQCFWCGTLRRNARTELLGQVLIIASFHVLLVNLMLPSPWALIPVVTYIAFLITLGMHFHKELG